MVLFCPTCANFLCVEEGARNDLRFACSTCPYIFNINKKIGTKTYPKLKEVGHVMGGAAAWENVDSTDAVCPACGNGRAYFMQMQTRSADEPMTTFYKCCNHTCAHNWKDRRINSKIVSFLTMELKHFQNGVCERPALLPLNSEIKIRSCNDPTAVNFAVDMLTKGEIIALPTDTVYGLACNANNCQALQNIYNVKGRSESKPVAICVSEVIDLQRWSIVEHLSNDLLNALLPGPVTLILYKNQYLNSPFLNPGTEKIGIRIPDYSFIRAVAKSCGFPLALTSANLSNEPSSLTISEFSGIWNKLSAIFDGGNISNDASRRAASTVIDLSDKGLYKIIREGIALQETERILHEHGLKKNMF